MAYGQVPKFKSLVHAAGQRGAPVGRERDRKDETGMTGEGTEYLSGRDIPKLEGFVIAPR